MNQAHERLRQVSIGEHVNVIAVSTDPAAWRKLHPALFALLDFQRAKCESQFTFLTGMCRNDIQAFIYSFDGNYVI